jgi:NADH:ubiquinone oxidoreductase subunit 4 (subunit M)
MMTARVKISFTKSAQFSVSVQCATVFEAIWDHFVRHLVKGTIFAIAYKIENWDLPLHTWAPDFFGGGGGSAISGVGGVG